jgi:hypothetical protein
VVKIDFTVAYAVEEHPDREVDTVTVETDTLSQEVSAEEKAVNLAAERSVYTHTETLSVTQTQQLQ